MSAENTFDKLAGKAKEVGGDITGDQRLESEGKVDQVKAAVEEKIEDVKGVVEGIKDSLTDNK
ncbi:MULTISPECIES: CsbD family protein [unclassified Rothia (in: high G+C Gram-positive bacteria)]|uniref:CsbD family protein n=1 Tax=unclassified Rothia (in: high G+C Gram-positive bacteria) TaxID=2689056 RepID=UPI00195934AB|nr:MULTISPECIES: CsbD family protein [unclassified Rothia (in: high G+C Gram-positive bacteria)]MBM7051778.1 CsbD family protein [Rothia sp. ZJ1223]QRZ61603.1 CsbD family protein [Rothia sp. ZJ932]